MLKRTALYNEHIRLTGRMVDFGGWELPVQYSGIIDEHLACRGAVGIFDVSHMGEFHLEGPDAAEFLNFAITNDVARTAPGQAQYTVLCHENGGIVDDLVYYRRAADRFLIVVNASNTEKDFAHFSRLLTYFKARSPKEVQLTDESAKYSQIAVQGPRAAETLQKITEIDLSQIKTYRFTEGVLGGGVTAVVGRTGYTGEDGFEIYCAWEKGPEIWRALLEAGSEFGIRPCGLGARDSLRTEMKYPLYGHELTDETDPLEAGLGWVVKLEKAEFAGRSALQRLQQQSKTEGLKRKLVGIEVLERGIPRQGYTVHDAEERTIGVVTSGTHSPSLKKPIGIAYVDASHAAISTEIQVRVRDSLVKAKVVQTPFYKRSDA